MKFTVSTEIMQRLVSRVIKGASNNKLLALTSLVNISLNNGKLRLDTTDMTNVTSAIEYNVEGENFEIVISLDSFAKIVGKTTSENITLEYDNNSLKFIGNGTYNIEVPTNEEGNPIKFPMYEFIPTKDPVTIEYDDIKSIITANKSCIANDMSVPVLNYYYCGDEVISANQNNICLNSITLFDEPILISNTMMDLIGLFGNTSITVERSDNAIKFSSANFIVYGKLFDAVADYPAEPIEAYLTSPFAYNCKINKTLLAGAMDRLIIFTDKLDDGTLNLKFNNKGVTLSNKNNNSFETVPYLNIIEDNENIDYGCAISYDLLKNQVASNSSDTIDLYFGDDNDTCIKIVDTINNNTITKITSLQES